MRLYLKDYVTLASLVAGMVSMALVVEGRLHWACLFVWVAWVFDALDGVVARLTGKGNSLGGHLDAAVDFVGCALAPAMCVYLAYRELLGFYGATALASVPVVFGTIRHARNYANPPKVSNLWVGLPRSYSGMAIAGLLGSHLFVGREIQYGGIGLIVVLSYLGISTLPYQGRHHSGLRGYQTLCLVLTVLTLIAGLVVACLGHGLQYFCDALFFWMTGYALWGWRGLLSADERREYAEYITEWKKGFD